MILLLFDIDGTLLIGRSDLYRKPLNRAGREILHPDFSIDLIDRLGSLDAAIIDEAVAEFGMESTPELLKRFQERYFAYLSEASATATLLPGAAELLDDLEARADIALGLVTGNYREAARIKIDGVGLRFDRFRVGAFGDEKTTRAELVRRAVRDAKALYGREFPARKVIVVGDTLKDVACARDNGCPVIAVATGWTPREELAPARPDLLLDDLTQTEAFHAFCAAVQKA